MNGFADHGLSEDDFGSSKGGIAAFDAFPKTKATYLTRTRSGGTWTALLLCITTWLTFSETVRWFRGSTSYTFSVEQRVSHEMQFNLDIVIAMKCTDIHINVQDAAGDRILAGETLKRDPTSWAQWGTGKGVHKLERGFVEPGWEREEDVHDYLYAAGKRRKFGRTPRLRGHNADSCRVYGNLDMNKVQGDFHITARGHGYMEFGEHLDHNTFNFSHQINELSFGPFYPSLTNPLDDTLATTNHHFFKFQYYLSIVPTIYTTDSSLSNAVLDAHAAATQKDYDKDKYSSDTIFTNQYAVTEQSHVVGETAVPGIFVKFDIEPITLTIAEEWGGLLALLVRLVNVVSGVLVAGGWAFKMWDWANEVYGRKRRGSMSGLGVLHGRTWSRDEKIGLD